MTKRMRRLRRELKIDAAPIFRTTLALYWILPPVCLRHVINFRLTAIREAIK